MKLGMEEPFFAGESVGTPRKSSRVDGIVIGDRSLELNWFLGFIRDGDWIEGSDGIKKTLAEKFW